MISEKKILIIDFCNFEDYPIGGYLSFAKNLLESFGNELVLVGITTTKNDPVGKWFKKEINGLTYDYFALARYDNSRTKHIIPDRLVIYILLKYHRSKILSFEIKNVFIQRQEIIQAINSFGFANICYCFAGLENPLSISKYRFAHFISHYFEIFFFRTLKKAKLILASGDESAILEMIQRSKGIINPNSVIQFPTRINTDIFYPQDKIKCRKQVVITDSDILIITTGRLAAVKGWQFMIDCFSMFNHENDKSLFYLIGVGEDQQKIQAYIELNKLEDRIKLLGKKTPEEIAIYLNAADLFIMGSYKEGWSTSLSESIACGVPSCVTNFSSAKDIISESVNGHVVPTHDVSLFYEAMVKALKIPRPVYNDHVKALSSRKLRQDLIYKWKLL